jgi:prepilin-type N-terminal cleavage/methylation domain-containing protein
MKKGFSIVELMIVVAIIGILATISGITYARSKMRTRDAKRIADINSISQALFIYKEKNNSFPMSETTPLKTCSVYYQDFSKTLWWEHGQESDSFLSELSGQEMETVPTETKPIQDKDIKAILGQDVTCTYRYLNSVDSSVEFSSKGRCSTNYAVLSASLEIQRKVETEDQRPRCLSGTISSPGMIDGVSPLNKDYAVLSSESSGGGVSTIDVGFSYAKYLPTN